ncbi:MAG: VOC family protein [Pseudomonadota bacterium]
MIIPNLMVSEIARSIAFYRDRLGMDVKMTVNADKSFDMTGAGDVTKAVFAILTWNDQELMLQTNANLAAELPDVFQPDQKPVPAGTVYIRGLDPRTIQDRVEDGDIIKGPDLAWYGMLELYLRDPDGHIICCAAPDGTPPA